MSEHLDAMRDLLCAAPLVDGHNDLAWEARERAGYDWDRLGFGPGNDGATHTDLPRLRAGGVGAQFWSVWVPCSLRGADAVTATLEQIDAVHRLVERFPDDLVLATTADDVRRAAESGRIASLLGAEGGHSIDDSLAVLRMFHRLGVRYLTLTHNDNTGWADSATDEPAHGGLTDFGREVVRELNRLGMFVDCSHVSADTMRDALDVTAAPIVFSHSGARAVCSSPRNVPDDVLERLSGNGGVCMAVFAPQFVSQACWDWTVEAREAAAGSGIDQTDTDALERFRAEHEDGHPFPTATLGDVVTHIEHLREVAGVDHIGIGGDFDGISRTPAGLEDVSRYPALFAALADRRWSTDDLRKLAGHNVLRAFDDVASVARDLAGRSPSLVTSPATA